jgi:hypothetical protein
MRMEVGTGGDRRGRKGNDCGGLGFPLRVAFACALMGPHTATGGGLVSQEELGRDAYGTRVDLYGLFWPVIVLHFYGTKCPSLELRPINIHQP